MSLFKILTWPVPFKGYIVRQLIALDQAINTAFGGYPDETISSRLGRSKGDEFADDLCEVLDLVEKDHCETSIEFDKDGKPAPKHLGPRSASGGTGENLERGGSLSEVGKT